MFITQSKFEGKATLHSWNSNVRNASDALFGIEIALKNSTSQRRSSFEQNPAHQKAAPNPSRIQGKYIGVAFGVGVPDNFEIKLRYAGGSRFTGKAKVRNSSDPNLFINTSLSGRVVDGSLLLTQTEVINGNLPPGTAPCLREGRLKITVSKGKILLRGPWKSDNPGCGFSKIRLQKQ